jgi:excisionase family DNA binding protein
VVAVHRAFMKREPIEPELYSLETAAALASVSKATIQRLCARGQLQSVLVGGSRRLDAKGQAVLVQKPKPPEFEGASAGSRLAFRRAVEREEQEVVAAARHAMMPDRPAGWDKFSAADRRVWWLAAEKAQKGTGK